MQEPRRAGLRLGIWLWPVALFGIAVFLVACTQQAAEPPRSLRGPDVTAESMISPTTEVIDESSGPPEPEFSEAFLAGWSERSEEGFDRLVQQFPEVIGMGPSMENLHDYPKKDRFGNAILVVSTESEERTHTAEIEAFIIENIALESVPFEWEYNSPPIEPY